VLLHVLADLVGHLLVEAAQQNRPHHDCGIESLKFGENNVFAAL
jgi:hypothetical protein